MTSVIEPLKPGDSSDEQVNQLLTDARSGWWNDSAMFGELAHQPALLKAIVGVFESFFAAGRIPAYVLELMRLKTGELNRCGYSSTVRTGGIRDVVAPKEEAIFGRIDAAKLTRKEYLAVKLAEYVAADPNEIPESFYQELKAEYSQEEVVELIFACSVFNLGNKFSIAMRLDTDEDSNYPHDIKYPADDIRPKSN